jgi:hypothetical protein
MIHDERFGKVLEEYLENSTRQSERLEKYKSVEEGTSLLVQK